MFCVFVVFMKVFIQGRANLNRAVHDDIVAIEILPELEWTCPSSLVIEDVEEKPDEDADKDVRTHLQHSHFDHLIKINFISHLINIFGCNNCLLSHESVFTNFKISRRTVFQEDSMVKIVLKFSYQKIYSA